MHCNMKAISKYLLIRIFLFSSTSAIFSCGKNGVLKETGPVTIETRAVGTIKEITLTDKIDLVLTEDSVQLLRVEAGANLLRDIKTELSGSSLTVRDDNQLKWARSLDQKVTVYLSTNTLEKIYYNGAGDISSTNQLNRPFFGLDCLEGTGTIRLKLNAGWSQVIIRDFNTDITLEGYTPNSYVYCAAQGSVDLRNYKTDYSFVDHRSIRDSYLSVDGKLEGAILYTGNVYYKGNPSTVNVAQKNSGKLIRLN